MVAGPFHSCPPNSSSCYENWTHPRVYFSRTLGVAAGCCTHSTLETGRDSPRQGSPVKGGQKDLGWPAFKSPYPCSVLGIMSLGGLSSLTKKGQLESHLTSFFPSSLGGFWWNSAVSWLGEMHVLLHVLHRECVFCHRVSLDSVHSSEPLSRHTSSLSAARTFLRGSAHWLSWEEGWV